MSKGKQTEGKPVGKKQIQDKAMANKEKKGAAIRVILIIVAVVLLVFICWKAGWILNGNKNEVSEQEKQEAIQEAVEDINATMEAEHSTVIDAQSELKDLHEDLQEVRDELHDALK